MFSIVDVRPAAQPVDAVPDLVYVGLTDDLSDARSALRFWLDHPEANRKGWVRALPLRRARQLKARLLPLWQPEIRILAVFEDGTSAAEETLFALRRLWRERRAEARRRYPMAPSELQELRTTAVPAGRMLLARPRLSLQALRRLRKAGRPSIKDARAARRRVKTPPPVESIGGLTILPPLVKGTTRFTTSRIAVLPDGTPITVLGLLAWGKFGQSPEALARRGLFAFWTDGNDRNETPENVELATLAASKEK